MKKLFLLYISFLFTTSLAFANASEPSESHTVQFYFAPSLTVCQNSSSGFLDCSSLTEEGIAPVKVQLVQTAQVNELEIWAGEFSKDFKEGSFQATFHAQISLLSSADSSEKSYEFTFLIKNSLTGALTSTAVVHDPSQLNLTHLKLPGIKNGDKTFLIGLSYGALPGNP